MSLAAASRVAVLGPARAESVSMLKLARIERLDADGLGDLDDSAVAKLYLQAA